MVGENLAGYVYSPISGLRDIELRAYSRYADALPRRYRIVHYPGDATFADIGDVADRDDAISLVRRTYAELRLVPDGSVAIISYPVLDPKGEGNIARARRAADSIEDRDYRKLAAA